MDSRTALPQYHMQSDASTLLEKMFEFHDFNSSTGFLAVVYTPTFTLMYAVHVRVYTQTYAWQLGGHKGIVFP